MWMFEFQLEYSSFHLNIRVSTWIFEFPLEYSTFQLNIRVSTWILEIPLDIRLGLQGSTFHENRLFFKNTLDIRVSTWIFEFPLEYSSFHLNIRDSAWYPIRPSGKYIQWKSPFILIHLIFEFPLEYSSYNARFFTAFLYQTEVWQFSGGLNGGLNGFLGGGLNGA